MTVHVAEIVGFLFQVKYIHTTSHPKYSATESIQISAYIQIESQIHFHSEGSIVLASKIYTNNKLE